MIFSLLLLAVPLVAAAPDRLSLFHRLHVPAGPPSAFVLRGSLDLQNLSFHPAPSFPQDLATFAHAFDAAGAHAKLALYQVALEHVGDTTEAQWDISSVKACHLNQVATESIHLHTLDPHNPSPYAIDYFVSPIPHDGACPKSRTGKAGSPPSPLSPFHAFADNADRLNTTVILRGSNFPPLPELTMPPPLSAEGEPIVPVPEKTFLQKYWVYIVALVMLTLVSGGGGEEEAKK